MKIVILGGSGLIGGKLVKLLKASGHEAIAASPSSGVDATTGKGLREALKGAEVVVNVANSPSFDENAAVVFFEKSGKNLAEAENEAGIKHHVALSIVGAERLAASGYFRAKYVQEQLIKASKTPYTIVQSTQFYEFLDSIAQSATSGQTVRLPTVSFQPIAADDVTAILADIAVNAPLNATIEIGGPKRSSFYDMIGQYLKSKQDTRFVIADSEARYFGLALAEDDIVPGKNPRLGSTSLESWLKRLR
jgi:uncharacterized protein YbjT (DUF2867 family)